MSVLGDTRKAPYNTGQKMSVKKVKQMLNKSGQALRALGV
jgi:hypothetical protein